MHALGMRLNIEPMDTLRAILPISIEKYADLVLTSLGRPVKVASFCTHDHVLCMHERLSLGCIESSESTKRVVG
jgi:hypothetical protein